MCAALHRKLFQGSKQPPSCSEKHGGPFICGADLLVRDVDGNLMINCTRGEPSAELTRCVQHALGTTDAIMTATLIANHTLETISIYKDLLSDSTCKSKESHFPLIRAANEQTLVVLTDSVAQSH